jgi:branched-chain amino acid transport system permease protein
MAYNIFALSSVVTIIALGTLLHLQFGRTGIVNFGVVGFVGVGMYGFAVLTSTYGLAFLAALVLATLLTAVLAAVLGWIILDLDGESVLVATLAFATIVYYLSVTEKELTGGVTGLGGVPYPVDAGANSAVVLLGILTVLTMALLLYAYRVAKLPYGRVLASIRDNEMLARSLGKSTFQQKLVLFTVTSGLMGTVGAFYASVNQFLVPRMLVPGLTFTVWIALTLGGRAKVLGPVVGVLISVALFDLVIEPYAPIPRELGQMIPDLKLMLYGLILIAVIMFRPLGLLGGTKAAR